MRVGFQRRGDSVKAAAFEYHAPTSVAEAIEKLGALGEDAKLLAGGQSLIPTLNMRLSAPEILVDLTGLDSLKGITTQDNKIKIGALTTHRAIEHSAEIGKHLPLLAQAAPHIAHVAIRNAGTFGGSLALADPAAEWPACCLALDAEFVIAGKQGERRVKAREFYKGLYETALKTNEVLVAAEIPIPAAGTKSVFMELARRQGDYALAGVAALAKTDGGKLTNVQLAFLGAGPTAILARKAMAAAEGKKPDAATIAAAQQALDADLSPTANVDTSAAAKLHLAKVLCGRALAALA
jgi:carbon-monoxide dehydrogenase medium subunit